MGLKKTAGSSVCCDVILYKDFVNSFLHCNSGCFDTLPYFCKHSENVRKWIFCFSGDILKKNGAPYFCGTPYCLISCGRS